MLALNCWVEREKEKMRVRESGVEIEAWHDGEQWEWSDRKSYTDELGVDQAGMCMISCSGRWVCICL